MADNEIRTVYIRGFPLALFTEAQQHSEALLREFEFIAAAEDDADVPRRLLQLVARLRNRPRDVNPDTETLIEQALERGDDEVDFTLQVPVAGRPIAVELRALLDEADEFCRRGDLLTLATVGEQREFRAWYLDEIVRQIDGEPSMSWRERKQR